MEFHPKFAPVDLGRNRGQMRVMFDLGHASHYYLLRPVMKALRDRGDEVRIIVRDREGLVSKLLIADGEKFQIISKDVKRGAVRKTMRMIVNDIRVLKIAAEFRPDVFLSLASPYAGFASFVLRKPHIIYTDTEVARIILLLALPFSTTMITPASFTSKYRKRNHIRTDGYKVLAYLNPKSFRPDPSVLAGSGLTEGDRFTVVRFSSYDASHDFGLAGLNAESRVRLVEELAKHSKVIVSSEVELEPRLKEFEYRLPPEKILDLIYYASLYVGEGATMACEAAVLGVPSVFIHRNTAGILDDLEREGLLRSFHRPNEDLTEIMALCRKMLEDGSFKREQKEKSKALFKKKEDPADVIIREVERLRAGAGSPG